MAKRSQALSEGRQKNFENCLPLNVFPFPYTVNPHYTDTRYNNKFRYTDNLTSTETLSEEVTVNQKSYRNIIIQYFKQCMFWIFVRVASSRRF